MYINYINVVITMQYATTTTKTIINDNVANTIKKKLTLTLRIIVIESN